MHARAGARTAAVDAPAAQLGAPDDRLPTPPPSRLTPPPAARARPPSIEPERTPPIAHHSVPARGRELDDDAVIVFAAVEATPTLDELAHGAPASRLRRQ